MEWNGGMDWTGLEWNGMAGCNFVIHFCGRDQTLTCIQAMRQHGSMTSERYPMDMEAGTVLTVI